MLHLLLLLLVLTVVVSVVVHAGRGDLPLRQLLHLLGRRGVVDVV